MIVSVLGFFKNFFYLEAYIWLLWKVRNGLDNVLSVWLAVSKSFAFLLYCELDWTSLLWFEWTWLNVWFSAHQSSVFPSLFLVGNANWEAETQRIATGIFRKVQRERKQGKSSIYIRFWIMMVRLKWHGKCLKRLVNVWSCIYFHCYLFSFLIVFLRCFLAIWSC